MASSKNVKRGSGKSKRVPAQMMDKLKRFVRSQGVVYLDDHNITSVGIGYKWKDGKPTDQISIQFTVAMKAAPEVLDSLNTVEIPKSFMIDGVEVPTDVLQRTFKAAMKIVAESTGGPRKTRIDPIVPGVSVANKKETAGTIGGIVFDRKEGTPYILSNWHVLHGPKGVIGDDIVQPGPFDDNRVQLNRLGKLVRSHVGAAGDCAIASIEDRRFDQNILELGVKIEQLGEPELGDKLIKSGRTTGVTHGIVRRVHTIVKIDYGAPIGEQAVGGFEIGPDKDNPAPDSQISTGGDSGSLWLLKSANGKPTKVMAGLHFAGEGSGDPDDHAIACYPKSVFEKLEISVAPPLQEETVAPGYDPSFLGIVIKAPKLSTANGNDAFKLDGSEVIPYTHFSLALSKSRRFAFWVAWNIDGGLIKSLSRKNLKFDFDPRVPNALQVGDDLYAGNRLDRGHIARRADLVWGSDIEAAKANKDSFFFTNITPQMDNFNQSTLGGLWGKLENAVFEEVDVDNLHVSVFGGPLFKSDDRIFRGVKIPREFYKVLAFVEAGKLKARAFLLTQNLDQLELLELNQFKVFQVTLTEVEQRGGFKFPARLKSADGFADHLESQPEGVAERAHLQSLDDIKW